jgi:hypothetical protein
MATSLDLPSVDAHGVRRTRRFAFPPMRTTPARLARDADGARAISAIAATVRSTGCRVELCNLADRVGRSLAELATDPPR